MTFLTIFMRKSVKLKLRYVKNYILLNQKKKKEERRTREITKVNLHVRNKLTGYKIQKKTPL